MKLYSLKIGNKTFMALSNDIGQDGKSLLVLQVERTLKVDRSEARRLVAEGEVRVKRGVYQIAFSTEDGVVT